jgi:aryl-alcohol dehydrogenase-like predicted oxidoreductase
MDGKTSIKEIVQSMAELKKEGKIGFISISEVSAVTLR